jgi:hypothetical protein
MLFRRAERKVEGPELCFGLIQPEYQRKGRYQIRLFL